MKSIIAKILLTLALVGLGLFIFVKAKEFFSRQSLIKAETEIRPQIEAANKRADQALRQADEAGKKAEAREARLQDLAGKVSRLSGQLSRAQSTSKQAEQDHENRRRGPFNHPYPDITVDELCSKLAGLDHPCR